MKRKKGFYWVLDFEDEWVIAFWDDQCEWWTFPGTGFHYYDASFKFIANDPISKPEIIHGTAVKTVKNGL